MRAVQVHENGGPGVLRYEVAVRRLTGGRGVDVVYDSVGKTTAEKSINCSDHEAWQFCVATPADRHR